MSCPDCEPLLNPYLDGELPVPDVLAVERHLAECPVCHRRHEALAGLRSELLAARLDYPPPARLAARLRRPRTRPIAWWGTAALLAAAAALALLFFAPRFAAPGSSAGSELLDAHLRSLLPGHLVDVPSSDRHTVKPWFQGRVPFSPDVPDLAAEGFVLTGGRLEVLREQRALALVYQRREHIINLFISQSSAGAAVTQTRLTGSRGYHLLCWSGADLTYCAVSDLNAAELDTFAALVRSRVRP